MARQYIVYDNSAAQVGKGTNVSRVCGRPEARSVAQVSVSRACGSRYRLRFIGYGTIAPSPAAAPSCEDEYFGTDKPLTAAGLVLAWVDGFDDPVWPKLLWLEEFNA